MAWRDPTSDDKRPLRMSEVLPAGPPGRRPFFSSFFTVFALLFVLGATAAALYFLYDHHQRIAELTSRLNRNEQDATGSSGRTTNGLKQAIATLKTLEERVVTAEGKLTTLETTLAEQIKAVRDSASKDADQKTKTAIEPIKEAIREVRAEIKTLKATPPVRRSNPTDDNQ